MLFQNNFTGAKQEKANACYHQVSYFINVSPGFIWFIAGNISDKPDVCASTTLADAVKTFNCLHSKVDIITLQYAYFSKWHSW